MNTKLTDSARNHAIRDAASIRQQLRVTEALNDETLFNALELGKRMLTARRNPAVAPHTGQAALIRLVEAQRKILSGSTDLFRVHDELSKVGIEVGVLDENGSTPQSGFSENTEVADFTAADA
ncbi:hypothetical protein [Aurantiacibacter spongiae]|uniref:Terminase n=1 Tax=Aurantiacibacter spongiae TaxID=2488860 RepID=A0A3N5DKF7_9SPHN|nr:hypothetical protein [Aurantiacibacter spongiae]RPF72192.1 hypothetical protein EG799_11605 [Aurantiacibacter spongiae]